MPHSSPFARLKLVIPKLATPLAAFIVFTLALFALAAFYAVFQFSELGQTLAAQALTPDELKRFTFYNAAAAAFDLGCLFLLAYLIRLLVPRRPPVFTPAAAQLDYQPGIQPAQPSMRRLAPPLLRLPRFHPPKS